MSSVIEQETSTLDREELIQKVRVLSEQISAQEDMLKRTTDYMSSIQANLRNSKEEIEEKNKEINDSLRYAQRLQLSLKPDYTELLDDFTGFFFHLNQCQLIGGDLIYARRTKDGTYVAAIDCTGHGIPGAMLTMMAFSYLDEIILHQHFREPNEILSVLNRMVVKSLHSRQYDLKDGMDMALCRICPQHKELSFAGAKRPLWIIPNGHLEIYRGDRISIGENDKESFTNQRINLKPGDKLYMFSDGITDQFGGPSGKKFGRKRLKKLIEAIKDLNMQKQHEIISNTLESWRGEQIQNDDHLILGIKI